MATMALGTRRFTTVLAAGGLLAAGTLLAVGQRRRAAYVGVSLGLAAAVTVLADLRSEGVVWVLAAGVLGALAVRPSS